MKLNVTRLNIRSLLTLIFITKKNIFLKKSDISDILKRQRVSYPDSEIQKDINKFSSSYYGEHALITCKVFFSISTSSQ